MKKILIIEDDQSIREGLTSLLSASNYQPLELKNSEISVENIKKQVPDLILLDINLPNLNGRDFIRQIRKELQTPIIMVTSQNTEINEALSISFGADDFIAKPYNPTILLLRIAAILRRLEKPSNLLHFRSLEVDFRKGVISKKTVPTTESDLRKDATTKKSDTSKDLSQKPVKIELTKNELLIFRTLLYNQDRIVTRDDLMTELWDNAEYINDNALTVNISRLRDKLAKVGETDLIQTRKGLGYILK